MFLPHHQQPLQEAIDELMAQNVGSEEEEEAWWIYNDLYTQSYSNQKACFHCLLLCANLFD